jgi:hypothetical protein
MHQYSYSAWCIGTVFLFTWCRPQRKIENGREQHSIKGSFDIGKGHLVSSRKKLISAGIYIIPATNVERRYVSLLKLGGPKMSKYIKIPAQVMKIVIFHYGWLKKAEIPNGPCRMSSI